MWVPDGSEVECLSLAQVVILGSWDRVLHQAHQKEPAFSSAYVSAPLSVSFMNKQNLKNKVTTLGRLGGSVGWAFGSGHDSGVLGLSPTSRRLPAQQSLILSPSALLPACVLSLSLINKILEKVISLQIIKKSQKKKKVTCNQGSLRLNNRYS